MKHRIHLTLGEDLVKEIDEKREQLNFISAKSGYMWTGIFVFSFGSFFASFVVQNIVLFTLLYLSLALLLILYDLRLFVLIIKELKVLYGEIRVFR